MVQIRLLAGVTAASDDGTPVDVGPQKCRAVLAALALSAGEVVPVSRLIGAVWGTDPPRTAEKTLQGYVAALRRNLGPECIRRIGAAYRLELGPESVDVNRFREFIAAGEADKALAEWTGTPLAGVDAPGLQSTVDGLTEQWLGTIELDLERRIDTDPATTVPTLTQLTADHPFREGLWAQLMTALYRAGRQADALTTYQRARHYLVEELGVEPGRRLRELERLILDHDERLQTATDRPGQDSGPPATATPGGNLPQRSPRLFGRKIECDTVLEMLEAQPVVTLVGPGGIGKTALGLTASRRWQDDGDRPVWYVELAEISSAADVPRAVSTALGVIERSETTLTESVIAVLRSRPALLILDNCEHVLDGAASLARAVAGHAPDSRVLATSREGLSITDEQQVILGPLDPAGAAAELFAERARAVSGESVAEHRPDVIQICRRLDGMPLAIELAAARCRSMTPHQLLARLDDRFRLLTSGNRSGTDRHRTLRATVQWSYDLLSTGQRSLFERLAVFVGPFDLEAAESVAASADVDAVDVDRLLGDLVERSMVMREPGPFGPRFRLLETLRHFAGGLLAARADTDVVKRRHGRWCRNQTAAIHSMLMGQAEVEGVARLAALWPNLRAAVEWACTKGNLELADALVRPIVPEVNLRRQAEIGDWAERILALTPSADDTRVVFWLTWAAERHTQAGDRAGYEQVVHRHGRNPAHPLARYAHASQYEDQDELDAASPAAVAWLHQQGEDHAARLIELTGVASSLMGLGRFAELDDVALAMKERYRQGPPTLLYFSWGLLGYSAQFQGRRDEANRFFAEASVIDVPPGTYLVNRTVEARAVFDQGDRQRAFRMLRDHVDTVLATDYVDVARMIAVEFVNMTAAADRLAEAARVVAYLDTTGGFGQQVRETLISEAVRRIAADPAPQDDGEPLDGRQALAYMHRVLDDLAADT
ncbi:ATP-binding protein [Arthrobacter castelli]|uniref:ATP-binding protein n=1 Tax=Arthrobacter castelli TaxID=271431 RepID=UPI000411D442|nr:BTAD domain-containing putative transcriptional regulator [Arthrobacter castelli]